MAHFKVTNGSDNTAIAYSVDHRRHHHWYPTTPLSRRSLWAVKASLLCSDKHDDYRSDKTSNSYFMMKIVFAKSKLSS